VGTPPRFHAPRQQSDAETGLQYLRARYYDPSSGRFLSQDPAAGLLPNPATLHKYVYALDDPLRYTDPTGRCDPDQSLVGDSCLGPLPGEPGPWATQEIPPADPLAGLPDTPADSTQEPPTCEPVFTWGHGWRHLAGTGLSQTEVEAAIEAQVSQDIAGADTTGRFSGHVTVGGSTIQYRADTRPDGTIYIGTYFIEGGSGAHEGAC